ncbi:hypothetical protein X737_36840 [Mesorhizobium sp. L48C026A00]|nr:hypothetical protein X737_36840 [Mesorhizobium sp. L48C026A00]
MCSRTVLSFLQFIRNLELNRNAHIASSGRLAIMIAMLS